MLRNLIIIAGLFALTGCMSQSQIQGRYVASQDICRTQISQFFASNQSLANSLDGQASMGSMYGECMTKAGWRVAGPKPGTQVAQYPPSGAPSTNPSASAARVRPVENPQQGQALTTAQQQNPPSGAPSTNPSAAAAAKQAPVAQAAPVAQPAPIAPAAIASAQPVQASRTTSPVGISYRQPARPPTVPAAPYGKGAARQF